MSQHQPSPKTRQQDRGAAGDALARLARLEAVEAIRALKARYLAACDAKDAETMRACFADGEVAIDYGAIGCFDRADALVAVFRDIGCHPHMLEMHHGVNPQIRMLDALRASGRWGLHYQCINTREQTLTQLGAYYEDRYACIDGVWKITASRCVVTSTLVLQLEAAAVQALVVGRPPQAVAP